MGRNLRAACTRTRAMAARAGNTGRLKLPSGDANVRYGSILLKNSFSIDDGKILGAIRREALFRLAGYMKELMSRCGTS